MLRTAHEAGASTHQAILKFIGKWEHIRLQLKFLCFPYNSLIGMGSSSHSLTTQSIASTSSLCFLLHRLDGICDSQKNFYHKISFDWFERHYKWPEVKCQGDCWSFIWKLGMCNANLKFCAALQLTECLGRAHFSMFHPFQKLASLCISYLPSILSPTAISSCSTL